MGFVAWTKHVPKRRGEHDAALSESRLEEVAHLLYKGRKDSARSFVQDVRKLRDLAGFVTDQDLAAVIKWLTPLLEEHPWESSSRKYTCVSRLLFPAWPRRADTHMQRWVKHIRMLRQLAVTSYAGDILAAFAWVEDTPYSARVKTPPSSASGSDRDDFETALPSVDGPARSWFMPISAPDRRPSLTSMPSHMHRASLPASTSMPVEFGRPTIVTATATIATVRGKPSRPQHTLSGDATYQQNSVGHSKPGLSPIHGFSAGARRRRDPAVSLDYVIPASGCSLFYISVACAEGNAKYSQAVKRDGSLCAHNETG